MPSNMSPDELWKRASDDLQTSLTKMTFSLWIKSASISEMKEVGEERAIITIAATSAYHLQMLENRFYAQIKDALDRITGKKNELQFTLSLKKPDTNTIENLAPLVESQDDANALFAHPASGNPQPPQTPRQRTTPEEQNQPPSASKQKASQAPTLFQQQYTQPIQQFQEQVFHSALHRAGLREDYTFDTFAVSTSNEMAHAGAIAVSQTPGKAYNPLFLYGGVGVGKTHLMQAIGNNILRKNPEVSIFYTTGEEFTNEIVAAIQQKKTIQLKQRFRAYQVLLVDDIQFIAGKNTVQEEFFHTFNAITPAGGQIILTSDRPPHEINLLEDRLKSRFEAGLIIDIQQPTFELRTAIILIKSKKLGLDIPMDLAQSIASEVESTRKLEGILVRLHSEVVLFKKPLTPELVSGMLERTERAEFPKNSIKSGDVIKTVANHFHISTAALKGPSRIKNLVEARHIAMYILHCELGLALEEIGGIFGGRDHTSVIHASNKIKELIPRDEPMRTNVNAIKTSLSFSTSV
jgi:chromosomal replication initiator protein